VNELAAVVAELAQRERTRSAIRGELFDLQLQTCDDPAQFRALHSGRRAGKSEFIPRAAACDAMDAGFDEVVIIGAETQKKAKALHWLKLRAVVRRHNLQLTANKQDGTWETPWGSRVVFWGLKDEGAVDLMRGFNVKAAYFDEVATYAALLDHLVFSVMEPTLGTTGGTMTLCGTPSVTRAGPWFDICSGATPGWSVRKWDALVNKRFPSNPRNPDAAAWFRSVCERNGWTEDNATFQREYRGEFVDDPGMQVYRYLASRNDVDAMPPGYDPKTWSHTIGVDFGVNDDCAWVILASAPHSKVVYVLRAQKRIGLLTDEAAKVTAELCEEFKPERLVGDSGGLGKPYVEEWNRRHAGKTKEGTEPQPGQYGMPAMLAADKQEKRSAIDFVNAELGATPPRLRFVQPSCKPLTLELQTLPWGDENRLKEHPGHANHCADAMLYAERKHMAYLNEAPGPSLADRDPDEAMAWQEAQEAGEGARKRSQADWERF
jgi:hypothetical protein